MLRAAPRHMGIMAGGAAAENTCTQYVGTERSGKVPAGKSPVPVGASPFVGASQTGQLRVGAMNGDETRRGDGSGRELPHLTWLASAYQGNPLLGRRAALV